jgi:hypothetical protein
MIISARLLFETHQEINGHQNIKVPHAWSMLSASRRGRQASTTKAKEMNRDATTVTCHIWYRGSSLCRASSRLENSEGGFTI